MDNEQFRLVLLLIGVVLVVGVYYWDRMRGNSDGPLVRLRAWFGSLRKQAEPTRRAAASRDEPHIGHSGMEHDEDPLDEDVILGPVRRVERGSRRRSPDAEQAREESRNEVAPDRPAAPAAEDLSVAQPAAEEPAPEVISMMLIARAGRIGGIRLSRALESQGLSLGDMSIYHRLTTVDGEQETLFSVANLVEPGTFDAENMASFSTPGVALFMAIPGPSDPRAAFDIMLSVARHLAESLDGVLVDGARNPLDEVAFAAMRDRVEAASPW